MIRFEMHKINLSDYSIFFLSLIYTLRKYPSKKAQKTSDIWEVKYQNCFLKAKKTSAIFQLK